jgi:hypothetical protein
MSTDIISGREERGGVGRSGYSQAVRDLFVSHYALTGNLPEAASAAGVTERTGRNWLRDPAFVSSVTRHRQMALAAEAAGIAYAVHIEIMTAKRTDAAGVTDYYAPVSERRQAAKTVFELAGHTPALAEALAKAQDVAALHDLTEDQLEAHIRAGQELLGNLRESGATPNVTPHAAADGLL